MKYLPAMLRVRNLERAVNFYTRALGFSEVTHSDHADGRFTLCFLRADPDSGPMLELTYNWVMNDYDNGNAYGHMAYQVESIDAIGQRLAEFGQGFS